MSLGHRQKKMTLKIGVTGASGFIGKRVIEMGLDHGYHLSAFVRPSSIYPQEWDGQITIFKGDIANENDTKKFVAHNDVIIHAAAVVTDWAPREEYQRITIDGTQFLLDQLKGTEKKIILISSIAVYSSHLASGIPCTGDLKLGKPLGNYSWAKQEQEKLIKRYSEQYGIPYCIIRPGNVFGPYSIPWVHEYVAAMKKGPILIDGGKHRALVYIDNVVDLILKAANMKSFSGQIYNGTDENDISWEEYATSIARTLKLNKPKSIGHNLAFQLAKMMEFTFKLLRIKNRPPLTKESLYFVSYPFDVPYDNATADLNYRPIVQKEEALKLTMEYISDFIK